MINAAGYFLQIYIMFEEIGTKGTAWFALALAALIAAIPLRGLRPPRPLAAGGPEGQGVRGSGGHFVIWHPDSHQSAKSANSPLRKLADLPRTPAKPQAASRFGRRAEAPPAANQIMYSCSQYVKVGRSRCRVPPAW